MIHPPFVPVRIGQFGATLLIALGLPAIFLPAAAAQPAPAAEAARDWPQVELDRPWIYRGSDVPPDPEWRFGELANGLRYAVRFNEVPQDQLSIRVRIDAGSLHERDDEQGYAHLLEHLTFRQSKYLAEGETIPRWEQLGATFGSDTNAETTPTQTVYKLDVPDVDSAKIAEVFRLLSGMITAPTLSQEGVRAEVPIVLAEKRERGGAALRVAEATRQTFFAGQKLAVRAPIGTEETLQAATRDKVRAFHQRWYRPQNTVISIAGDVDPAVLEQMLETHFGGWKVRGKPVRAPDFGKPAASPDALMAQGALAPVGEVRILVEPDLPRNISYAVLRPWQQVADTIAYNEALLLDQLALSVLNRRLEARARAGADYLAAQVGQDDINRSADVTFVSITPLTEDWQAALADVRATIAAALDNPPRDDEIARELAEFENAFAIGVETSAVQQATDLANNIVEAVDIRETVAAPDTVLNVLRGMRPKVTPDAVLRHTRALFAGTVLRALMTVPQASQADAATLRTAMLAPVDAAAANAEAKPLPSFADLPPLGKPGKVVEAGAAGLLGIETLTLSNGVRAMLWANDAEAGRVSVRVRFGNGYGAFDADSAAYADLGEAAIMGMGIGDLGQDALDRLATGRKLGLGFRIEENSFLMSAETRAADLEDQLYLFAAKLVQPRWDENPVLRARAALGLSYPAFATSPQGVIERDLEYLLRGRDPRFQRSTTAQLDALTPQGLQNVWEPILASGPVSVEIFGDFDRAQAMAALERTFGAMDKRSSTPALPQLSVLPVTGGPPVVLAHRGDANQAAAVIGWPTGGGREQIRLSRQVEILAQLFNNRLFDAMRERLGASYAPGVRAQWPLDREEGGMIVAMAQLQPKDVPAFYEEAERIAADLAQTAPAEIEIARVTEPLRQLVSRSASGNGFWLNQLGGAARDPARFEQVRSILTDYSRTTPEMMQTLARRFLGDGKTFKLSVLPQGQSGASDVAG
ncbi:insulinase family protein [Croceicoccus sp. F390]|uniref:Insulinase family protein n=1 Tax=Croceicoccus esteveae TaxID=3075597 RepID=A0ABU2ZH93_9SPHN|nr:insulinase family protein [Croceicoccus sp. F390]MDT0574787.1 insulinase family protein [Croceicoccus sp. F390]